MFKKKSQESAAVERSTYDQYVGPFVPLKTKKVSKNKQRSIKKFIKKSALLVLVVILATGGYLGWHLYAAAAKITGDKNPLQVVDLFKSTTLKQSDGRTNVLLAGYSADDPGHQGAELTDSIMIVSYNPTTKSVTMLSIPRDLYVYIPGFGHQKINAAYEDGQKEGFSKSGYDAGGMGLLEEVINNDLGIQIDYYGLLDYSAFKDAVNAVGGVTVDIQSTDPRGLYDPNTNLNLTNGEHTLNGQQALNLARARGDGTGAYGFPNGDFNRTQHQQQLLVALKDKASSLGFITNPVKIADLADAIGDNLKTNMSLGVITTLYKDTKGISDSSFQSITLNNYQGQNYLTDYRTESGEDALAPAAGLDNYSDIDQALSVIFNTTQTGSISTSNDQ